jgi:hypothetical protein
MNEQERQVRSRRITATIICVTIITIVGLIAAFSNAAKPLVTINGESSSSSQQEDVAAVDTKRFQTIYYDVGVKIIKDTETGCEYLALYNSAITPLTEPTGLSVRQVCEK